MTTLEIETAFVKHLKSAFTDVVTVEAFPSEVEDYDYKSAGGCVLVRYETTVSDDPVGNESQLQADEVMILLRIGSRSLRARDTAHIGCYEILDAIRIALRGFTVGAKPPDVKGLRFAHRANGILRGQTQKTGVWWYEMYYVAHGVNPTY